MALLAQLKDQTADCHVALEKSMDVFRRVQSRDDYVELLRRFYTLYEPLEARLTNATDWSATGWDFAATQKTAWLREDLQALGVSAEEMAEWSRAERLPPLEDFGEVAGCLYVLEGSTLGGQVISRQFADKLGITPETGGKFFRGYGEATGRHWRAFGQWAEAQAAAQPIETAAVRGARDTFNSFAHWMSQ